MGTNNSKDKSNLNGNLNRKPRTVSSSSSTVSYNTRTSSLPAFLRCGSDKDRKKAENPPYPTGPFVIKKKPFEDDYVFTHSRLGNGVSGRSGGGVFLCLRRSDQAKFAVKVSCSYLLLTSTRFKLQK